MFSRKFCEGHMNLLPNLRASIVDTGVEKSSEELKEEHR
jgi:hypothetical protein